MNHPNCPQCRADQRTWRVKAMRRAMPLLAAGLVGAVLPLANHAEAGATSIGTAKKAAFSGYSTEGQAQPIRVEVFEPTIPIPATPQAEIELGYTTTEADSSSSHGRASYVWPGDAVGEGFKTIAEGLGIPLPGEVTEGGYPVQVNSAYPAGPETAFSQPTPGQVMRTSATKQDTIAETAFSSDCKTSTEDPGDGGSGGGGLPGLPGLPLPSISLPAVPGLSGLSGLTGLSLKSSRGVAAKADDGTECMTPTELDAVVSMGNYQSVTKTHAVTGKQVYTESRAAVSDIKFAGGLVTLSGVSASSRTSSDGKKPKVTGKAHFGTLAVAGQKFTLGPDGVEAAGGTTAIPGLPDAPAAALAQLGISFEIPKPVFEKKSKAGSTEGSTAVEALIVTIDAAKLRSKLDAIPFDDITGMLPDQLGDLKSALQAATHLSTKFVIHLGVSETEAKTVPPIPPLPPVPTTSTTATTSAPATTEPAETTTSAAPGGNNGNGNPAPPAGGGGGDSVPDLGGSDPGTSDVTPPSTETPPSTIATPELIDSKLPGLFSIPGLLLYGGLAGGALAGAYVRRLGLAALGGTSACPHGLDSGLPDLRKA